MGDERTFGKTRLVVGTLRSPSFPAAGVEAGLASIFGEIDYRGPELAFDFSDYYEAEMGKGLIRSFYSFARLVDPAGLASMKRATDRLEREFVQASPSPAGGRPVNLDPGILALGKFILATTKDRSHRIPLREGIYAELTLYYEGGAFRPLPWTYPDWKSDAYLAVLSEIRGLLKADLKRGALPGA
jgi:hypothetical protein